MMDKIEKLHIAEVFRQEQRFKNILDKILDMVSPEVCAETLQELDKIVESNTKEYVFAEARYTAAVLGNKAKAEKLMDGLLNDNITDGGKKYVTYLSGCSYCNDKKLR